MSISAPFVRRITVAMAAVLAWGTLTACGSGEIPGGQSNSPGQSIIDKAPVASPEEIATSPTAQAIKQRGQLLVGSSLEIPLMSQQNPTTGQTEGFDATMGRLLAKYILGEPNVKIVGSVVQIREALIQNGTVDAVFHQYSITTPRLEKVGFAGPYMISGPALMARKGDNRITRPEDVKGKKVVAVANSTGQQLIQKYGPAETIPLPTGSECVAALEQGRAEVYVNDLTQLASTASLNNKVQVNSGTFGSDPYGIGIKKDDNTFKKFLNDWLRKIIQQGLWLQTYQESLGKVIQGEPPKPPEPGSIPGTTT